MEVNQQYLDKYEEALHKQLYQFLQSKKEVDAVEPDVTDFESVWQQICTSYIPDGVREFEGYATVSVGWIMYVGMAIAKQWDADWDKCKSQADMYTALRDVRGFDCMDEYISEDILKLKPNESKTLAKLIGDCAQMGVHALQREMFEPGSPLAFHAYIRTLHQMYLMGIAVQLLRMGYKMTKIG